MRRSRQRGFSLVAAIFLIVVLAALGSFAVEVAMSDYQRGDLELLEARAQAAAQAGLEYGANRALKGGGLCAPRTVLRPAGVGLGGIVVLVTCVRTTPHALYNATLGTWTNDSVYELTSTATSGTYGQADYVARTLTRAVTDAGP